MRSTSLRSFGKRQRPSPQAIGLRHGFRSGLEDKNSEHLKALGEPVVYEQLSVRYAIPLSFHTYTMDFRLANGILVETKGLFDPTDRAKHLFVKTQYPDLDVRFVFSRATTPLRKGAKSSYADWCEKHGFRYAEKLIPEEWVKEPGPKRRPEDVISCGPLGYQLERK